MTMVAQQNYQWPRAYRHHAVHGNVLDAGLALLGTTDDFRCLWVDAQSKRPLTRGRVKDATGCGSELFEAWECLPEGVKPGLAVTLPEGLAIVDNDSQTEIPKGLPETLFAYEATARGLHWFVTLPEPLGFVSRHATGELRAGRDSFTIIAPSPGKAAMLPMLEWADLPEHGSLWMNHLRAAARRAAVKANAIRITTAHTQQATNVVSMLVAGRFGGSVAAILAGNTSRYQSRSEADFGLAFMASHFTREPGVLASILQTHSGKFRDVPERNRSAYLSTTVWAVLHARQLKDYSRLNSISHSLSLPGYDLTALALRSGSARSAKGSICMMPSFENVKRKERKELLVESVLGWAALQGCGDEYDRPYGWRRIPVEDFGALFGYTRETIRQTVLGLVEAGLIERDKPVFSSDKGDRRDTLIRLVKQ